MTNSTGDVVNKYAYGIFGQIIDEQEQIENPFKYIGAFGVMDEENGLYFMRARYYDTELGRFVSKDPIGLLGGMNMYAYVGSNPVNLIDPLGLDGFGLIGDAQAEAGLAFGAGELVTPGGGIFWGGDEGFNAGTFVTGGAFAGGLGTGFSAPRSPGDNVIGAYIGGGGGLFYTNADSAEELKGLADTYSVNLGAFIGISIQFSINDDGTWIFSIAGGKGIGLSVSAYTTCTLAKTLSR